MSPKWIDVVSDIKDYSWSLAYPAIPTGITCSHKALWQGSCAHEVHTLETALEFSKTGSEIYVSPSRHHWPVYDPVSRSYVDASDYKRQANQAPDPRESLLDLPREEAWSLSIVRVFHDLKQDLVVVVTRPESLKALDCLVTLTYIVIPMHGSCLVWLHQLRNTEAQLSVPVGG